MARTPIHPGQIDWSGENPGMYLKDTADGPYVTLVSFFRVICSPHGKGHAAFILQDPMGTGRDAARPNLCITDNEPLAAYVRDGFVAKFGSFRDAKGLSGCRMVPGWDFMAGGDARIRVETTDVLGGHPDFVDPREIPDPTLGQGTKLPWLDHHQRPGPWLHPIRRPGMTDRHRRTFRGRRNQGSRRRPQEAFLRLAHTLSQSDRLDAEIGQLTQGIGQFTIHV